MARSLWTATRSLHRSRNQAPGSLGLVLFRAESRFQSVKPGKDFLGAVAVALSGRGGDRTGRSQPRDIVILLVITPSAKARNCAQTIQQVTSEETQVVATSSQALAQLRAREYVAVLIDQAFLETEPVESDMVLQHIGTAVPVHVNFAINNMDRVGRELRAALHRHQKAVQLIRQEVQHALPNALKGPITALLLSCEMALQIPDLHSGAESRMRAVYELAKEIRLKLEGPV